MAELKKRLTALSGTRNSQISSFMRLIHQGKVLSEHDGAYLSQIGIKDGSFIQVEQAGALKGGSKRTSDGDDDFKMINTGI